MEKTLNLYKQFPDSKITQGFSENANTLYKSQGLVGHTTLDYGIPYGTPIASWANDAYCYSVLNRDNPDLSKYRGVFTLVETDAGVYEVSYGHASKIHAEVGKTYNVGDTLMECGNTGPVYVGGVEVSTTAKLKGSKAGAHLHGPQIRPVKKVKKTSKGKTYLLDGFGIFKKDGFYYEVIDFNNGTNGCVSPAKLFAEKTMQEYLNLTQQISLLTKVVGIMKFLREKK